LPFTLRMKPGCGAVGSISRRSRTIRSDYRRRGSSAGGDISNRPEALVSDHHRPGVLHETTPEGAEPVGREAKTTPPSEALAKSA
jgi:hypothetical protein